jgi:hypothetical protein
LLGELVAGCWVTTDDLLDEQALSAAIPTSVAVASFLTVFNRLPMRIWLPPTSHDETSIVS